MANDRLPSRDRVRDVLVDVLRVDEGQEAFVRTLSESYGGLFTHYVRERSQYCPGDVCACKHRKERRIWKGYAAVEVWEAENSFWRPIVLEMTENSEHCFAGRWRRGQVWRVFRRFGDAEQDSYPVQAILLEETDPTNWPPASDWRLVMTRKFYHSTLVESHHPNPRPRPVMAPPSAGPAPPGARVAPPVEAPPTPEQLATVRKLREQLLGGIGAAPPSANGHSGAQKGV